MKEFIHFGIHHQPKRPLSTDEICIPETADFEALCTLSKLSVAGKNPNYRQLVFDVQDESLKVALDLIFKLTGLSPLRSAQERCFRSDWFYSSIKRSYTRNDITGAPLLRLRSTKEIAYNAPGHHPDSFVLRSDAKLKKCRWDFGHVFWCEGLLCSDSLREKLELEEFLGIVFDPVIYEPPLRAHDRCVWRLTSSIQMPPITLPLIGKDGKEFTGPLTNDVSCQGCFIVDGMATSQQHYRFNRCDVVGLGSFDLAVTQERFGSWDVSAYRSLIVSQRFREVFERLKVPGAEFLPVYLDD